MSRDLVLHQPRHPADYAAALAGYDGPFLSERSEATLEECAEEGRLFLVSEADEVLGVAGVFQPCGDAFWELGGTLVKEPVRGYGLQRLMLAARVAHVEFFRGPGDDVLFASVAAKNEASIDNLKRRGFDEWVDPPQVLLDYKAASPLPGGAERLYFRLGEKAATAMLVEVAGMVDGAALRNRAGETLAVQMDLKVFHPRFLDDFLAFVEYRRG